MTSWVKVNVKVKVKVSQLYALSSKLFVMHLAEKGIRLCHVTVNMTFFV